MKGIEFTKDHFKFLFFKSLNITYMLFYIYVFSFKLVPKLIIEKTNTSNLVSTFALPFTRILCTIFLI